MSHTQTLVVKYHLHILHFLCCEHIDNVCENKHIILCVFWRMSFEWDRLSCGFLLLVHLRGCCQFPVFVLCCYKILQLPVLKQIPLC